MTSGTAVQGPGGAIVLAGGALPGTGAGPASVGGTGGVTHSASTNKEEDDLLDDPDNVGPTGKETSVWWLTHRHKPEAADSRDFVGGADEFTDWSLASQAGACGTGSGDLAGRIGETFSNVPSFRPAGRRDISKKHANAVHPNAFRRTAVAISLPLVAGGAIVGFATIHLPKAPPRGSDLSGDLWPPEEAGEPPTLLQEFADVVGSAVFYRRVVGGITSGDPFDNEVEGASRHGKGLGQEGSKLTRDDASRKGWVSPAPSTEEPHRSASAAAAGSVAGSGREDDKKQAWASGLGQSSLAPPNGNRSDGPGPNPARGLPPAPARPSLHVPGAPPRHSAANGHLRVQLDTSGENTNGAVVRFAAEVGGGSSGRHDAVPFLTAEVSGAHLGVARNRSTETAPCHGRHTVGLCRMRLAVAHEMSFRSEFIARLCSPALTNCIHARAEVLSEYVATDDITLIAALDKDLERCKVRLLSWRLDAWALKTDELKWLLVRVNRAPR